MFLHVSVILFTGGWYPSMHCRSPGPHSGGKLRGLAGGGVSPGPHPGGKLRGLAWGRGVSRPTPRGVSRPTLRGCLQAHTRVAGYPNMHRSRHPPADSYCCGRYASFSNALLFYSFLEESRILLINAIGILEPT